MTLKPMCFRWVAVLALLTACTKSTATIYEPPDGAFTVTFPGKPETETTQATSLAFGVVTVHMATFQQGQKAYQAMWTDYPVGSFANADAQASLDQARDGVIQGVQGTLLGEERISLGTYSGRSFRISAAGGRATLTCRMYQVGDRAYMLQVVTPKEDAFSPSIARFLDSFTLAEKDGKPHRWVEHVSSNGYFAVSFPGVPKEEVETVDTLTGPMNSYSVGVESRNAYCAVQFSDHPKVEMSGISTAEFLDGVCKRLAAQMKGSSPIQKDVRVKDLIGRRIQFTAREEGQLVTVAQTIFLVGCRQYQLVFAAPEDQFRQDDAEKFFSSFRLTASMERISGKEPLDRPYHSADGRFSVFFPYRPKITTRVLNTHDGKMAVHFFKSSSSNHLYSISYCDVPVPDASPMSPAAILDGAKKEAIRQLHGELLSDEMVEYNGYEGKHIQAQDASNRMILISRMFLISNRLYQASIVTTPEHWFDRTVDLFFKTLRLDDAEARTLKNGVRRAK